MFDLVIRHGLVVDGTGGEPFAADVAVEGDRIAAIAHRALDGEPVPGTYAPEDELFALGRAVKAAGKGIFEVAPAGVAGPDHVSPTPRSTGCAASPPRPESPSRSSCCRPTMPPTTGASISS